MALLKNFTATKAALFVSLLCAWAAACAGQLAGSVTDLSGPLLAKKADGTIKVLSLKSAVEQGDTLVSEKDTYARIKFIDQSEMTLRPNSQVAINKFSYAEDKPENDSIVFTLFRGGLRAVTGLLGKRNHDKFGLNTPAATIGIRGTIFIAEYIPEDTSAVAAYGRAGMAALNASLTLPGSLTMTDTPMSQAPIDFLPMHSTQLAQNTPGSTGGRSPGLYVQVLDGVIHLTNGGGTQNFTAGQFGFTPGFQQPPVILPTNPGMQFTPPPSFSSTTASQGGTAGGKPGDVDCQVR